MFKVGDRVLVDVGTGKAPATIIAIIDWNLYLTVFDDPSVGIDVWWTTPGSWLSVGESLSLIEDDLDYGVDE